MWVRVPVQPSGQSLLRRALSGRIPAGSGGPASQQSHLTVDHAARKVSSYFVAVSPQPIPSAGECLPSALRSWRQQETEFIKLTTNLTPAGRQKFDPSRQTRHAGWSAAGRPLGTGRPVDGNLRLTNQRDPEHPLHEPSRPRE